MSDSADTADRPRPTIRAIAPATGEVLGEVEACAEADVAAKVAEARRAQVGWGELPPERRVRCLTSAKEWIARNVERAAKTISDDGGKPRVEAITAEIVGTVYLLDRMATLAPRWLADEPISAPYWRMLGKRGVVTYRPLGVVGIISPWNFPFSIPFGQTAMALAAGNAVILKPSSATPLVGKLIEEVWREAGLPDGVLQVVHGPGRLGDALCRAGLRRILFTGSVAVGRHVMAEAARHMTPVSLELGGKDPMIVLGDADLDVASSAAVWGAFCNAGQVCASIERCYVHRSIFDDFVSRVVEKTRRLRQGPDAAFDVDVGAMTTEDQLRTVATQVQAAVRDGARILCGGDRPLDRPGWFFPPTVLVDLKPDMEVVREETFGPVLPILPFDSEEEAIRLANDSRYALTACLFTRDLERGERLARKIEAGTVMINDTLFTYSMAEAPWGGPKDSGVGRTHGRIGLMDLVEPVHVCTNVRPGRKNDWWYPYDEATWRFAVDSVRLFAPSSAAEKIGATFRGLRRMLGDDRW
jgi:succinate-semialdehyde dehydrogenase/glutarate-semialdehyde dehydrogenase